MTCRIPNCSAASEWPLPLCQRHWYRVPHALRTSLWAAFKNSGNTADYEAATQQAIAAAAEQKALPCG